MPSWLKLGLLCLLFLAMAGNYIYWIFFSKEKPLDPSLAAKLDGNDEQTYSL